MVISFLSAARDPRQRDGGGPPHKCFAQQNIGAGAIHLPRASYYLGAPTRLCLVGKNKKCFTPEIRGEALSMRSRYTCSRRAASRRLRLKTDLPCKSSVFRLRSGPSALLTTAPRFYAPRFHPACQKRGDAREQGNSDTRRPKNRSGEARRHFRRRVEQLAVAKGVQRDI